MDIVINLKIFIIVIFDYQMLTVWQNLLNLLLEIMSYAIKHSATCV